MLSKCLENPNPLVGTTGIFQEEITSSLKELKIIKFYSL